jgi:hypothetical protein
MDRGGEGEVDITDEKIPKAGGRLRHDAGTLYEPRRLRADCSKVGCRLELTGMAGVIRIRWSPVLRPERMNNACHL